MRYEFIERVNSLRAPVHRQLTAAIWSCRHKGARVHKVVRSRTTQQVKTITQSSVLQPPKHGGCVQAPGFAEEPWPSRGRHKRWGGAPGRRKVATARGGARPVGSCCEGAAEGYPCRGQLAPPSPPPPHTRAQGTAPACTAHRMACMHA